MKVTEGGQRLTELAALLRRRNRIERRIAELLGRPATTGNIGEAIASEIFGIELAETGVNAGHDGTFRSGPFKGKTVNIKLYAEDAGGLDISKHPADLYLVMTGPRPRNRRSGALPVRIDSVYLVDGPALHEDLQSRGVGIGVATSVRKAHWERSRVYPPTDLTPVKLSEDQMALLRHFAWQLSPDAHLTSSPVTAVGVDGAPGGWVAVELFEGRPVENGVKAFRHFAEVVEEYAARAAAIGVDMPIGLTSAGERPADREARAFIGSGLRSSVFAAPPTWSLKARNYTEARSLRPSGAKGISAQSFALVPRIREVTELVGRAPIYEVHPEVSFRAIKGVPLEWPKRTTEGREERLELLEAVGIAPPAGSPRGATIEDVIDATAAAWSAHRIATERSNELPESQPAGERSGVIHY